MGVNWPVDRQINVVPDDAALMLWCVVIGRFVKKFSRFAQHHKTMRKAFGHPELVFVFSTQMSPYSLSEGCAVFAQIHGHIEYFALNDPYQLSLGLPDLIVQAA